MRKNLILILMFVVVLSTTPSCVEKTIDKFLPRGEASTELDAAFSDYLSAVEESNYELHSIMIVQHGEVLEEKWLNGAHPDSLHTLNSVSKTFTATAVGFAVSEGLLSINDKVISFFPDDLPEERSSYLDLLEVRHLLTMTSGHDVDPTPAVHSYGRNNNDIVWSKAFFEAPLVHEPGSFFVYNTLGSYMLSAIVQKVTGQKVFDYLIPRLFEPLGIEGAVWQESPQGINTGGWGLFLKTEDLAKMGQFLLQKGVWKGEQLLPAEWVEAATSKQTYSLPADVRAEEINFAPEDSDWLQGYGYQMWRCRHNAVRADGGFGQYILILPDRDAVIAMTASIEDMQSEINQVWEHILPAL